MIKMGCDSILALLPVSEAIFVRDSPCIGHCIQAMDCAPLGGEVEMPLVEKGLEIFGDEVNGVDIVAARSAAS
jgi:hypothetical protein